MSFSCLKAQIKAYWIEDFFNRCLHWRPNRDHTSHSEFHKRLDVNKLWLQVVLLLVKVFELYSAAVSSRQYSNNLVKCSYGPFFLWSTKWEYSIHHFRLWFTRSTCIHEPLKSYRIQNFIYSIKTQVFSIKDIRLPGKTALSRGILPDLPAQHDGYVEPGLEVIEAIFKENWKVTEILQAKKSCDDLFLKALRFPFSSLPGSNMTFFNAWLLNCIKQPPWDGPLRTFFVTILPRASLTCILVE